MGIKNNSNNSSIHTEFRILFGWLAAAAVSLVSWAGLYLEATT